jgi:hypothetical protein
MNWASFCRGKIAGAVMVGSAGTAATAMAAKATVERTGFAYLLDIMVVACSCTGWLGVGFKC